MEWTQKKRYYEFTSGKVYTNKYINLFFNNNNDNDNDNDNDNITQLHFKK